MNNIRVFNPLTSSGVDLSKKVHSDEKNARARATFHVYYKNKNTGKKQYAPAFAATKEEAFSQVSKGLSVAYPRTSFEIMGVVVCDSTVTI